MKTSTSTFLLILLSCICFSQSIGQIPTDQAEKIDQLFAQYDNPNSPGCVIGVIDDGQFVYAKGYGMANIKEKLPFSPDTEFCIGSVTKQFTATCIGLLVQERKVNFEEDIRTYLPELSNYDQGITIRELLHHTSGIKDYTALNSIQEKTYRRFTTYQETLPLLQKQKTLNFSPNTKHLYSNSGYLLLQEIVRRVSGQSLQAFAKEHIFEPLNMNHSFYNTDFDRISSKNTNGYRIDSEENIVPCVRQSAGISNELIQTTLKDLLLWDQNFYHHKVGGEALDKMLHTCGILENGDTINYASGLVIGNYSGIRSVNHSGGNLGYGSEIIRFPEHKKSIIVLTNAPLVNPVSMARKIADIVLEKEIKAAPKNQIEPVPTIHLSNSELKQYCAPYWNTSINQPRYVYFKNGTIRYNRPDNYESPLVPIGDHTFRMLNSKNEQTATTVRFVLKKDGTNELYVKTSKGEESFSYQFEEANYSKKDFKQFEGRFFSDEVDFSFEVKLMGKILYLITDQKARYKLNTLKADYFIDRANRRVTFSRDEAQKINGFTMDFQRAKGLFFQKMKN